MDRLLQFMKIQNVGFVASCSRHIDIKALMVFVVIDERASFLCRKISEPKLLSFIENNFKAHYLNFFCKKEISKLLKKAM